ncbi:MAG: hypothetical protein HUJ95_03335 [Bacteroidales bacterium]|nr:hypothetical protein [Bacteroidales bacterium]
MKKIFAIIALALPLVFSSCVKDNIYGGVTISDIKKTDAFTEADKVTVTAKVQALIAIKTVNLVYDAGQGAQTVEMTPTNAGDGIYGAVIPGFPKDTKVTFHIEATTATGKGKSAEVTYTVGDIPIDYSALTLNELNGTDKFIELINNGADLPTLVGVYIEKDGKIVWTADNRPMKKGEIILLYSVDVCGTGGAHEGYDPGLIFDSGLSAKKAVRVQLFTPAAASLSDFNLTDCKKTAPASYSKGTDGKWYHADATPGAKNVDTLAGAPAELVEGLTE